MSSGSIFNKGPAAGESRGRIGFQDQSWTAFPAGSDLGGGSLSSPAWDPEARDLPVVFIVGAARSGTTLLYRSIQHHPSFAPAQGFSPVESHAVQHMLRVLGPGDVRMHVHAAYLGSLEALAVVARDIQPLALRRKSVRRVAGRHIRRPAIWKAAGEHHVLRRYFLEAHRRRGAPRLVEKTPANVDWVPNLRIAFPNSRFLFMVRHPIDVFTSFAKRHELDPEGSRWARRAPDAFAVAWERETRRALDLQRTEPRFLLVRYEDFTTHPEPAARRILDHLGEQFHEATLLRERRESEIAVTEKVREDLLKGDPLLLSEITGTTKRWDQHIDAAGAKQLEDRLRETMARVGYEPRVAAAAASAQD